MCGAKRWRSSGWCRGFNAASCNTTSGNIATNDPHLCQDPRVWENVPCRYIDDDTVHGLRCTGNNMRCVAPWYTQASGQPGPNTQCPDKSDQKFNCSLTCSQHLQEHMDFHTQNFCSENFFEQTKNYYYKNQPICTNKSEWLVEWLTRKDKK